MLRSEPVLTPSEHYVIFLLVLVLIESRPDGLMSHLDALSCFDSCCLSLILVVSRFSTLVSLGLGF